MRNDGGSPGQAKLTGDGGFPLGRPREKLGIGSNAVGATRKSEPTTCGKARHRPEEFGSGESSATWVPSDSCDETSSGDSGGSGNGHEDALVDCDLGSLRLRSLLRVANQARSASSSSSSSSSCSDGEDEDVGREIEIEENVEEEGSERPREFLARVATAEEACVREAVSADAVAVGVGAVDGGDADDGEDEEGTAELTAALEAVLRCPPQALARNSRGRLGRQQGPLLTPLLSPSGFSDTSSSRGGEHARSEREGAGESCDEEEGDEDEEEAAAAAVRAALAWSFPAHRLSCVEEEPGGCTTDDGETERATDKSGSKVTRSQAKEKPAWPNKASAKNPGPRSSGDYRPTSKTTTACRGRRRKSHADDESVATSPAPSPGPAHAPGPAPRPTSPAAAAAAAAAATDGIGTSASGSDFEDQPEEFPTVDEDTSVLDGIADVAEEGTRIGGHPPAAAVVDEGGGNAQRLGGESSGVRRESTASKSDSLAAAAAASCNTVEAAKGLSPGGGDEGVSGTAWSEVPEGHGGSANGMDGVQCRRHGSLQSLRLWNSFTSASSSSAPSDPQSHPCTRPWGSMNLGGQSGEDGLSGTALALEREKLILGVFGPNKAGPAMSSAGSGKHDSSRAFFAAADRIASLPTLEVSLLAELDRSSDEEEDGGEDGRFFGGDGGSVNGGGGSRDGKHGALFEDRTKDSDASASPGTSCSPSYPLPTPNTPPPRRSSFGSESSRKSPLVRVGSTRSGTGGGAEDGDETTPYRYRRLAGSGRGWPPRVDPASREEWLCTAEFEAVFRMTYAAFKALPLWKQIVLKREVCLF